MSALQMPLRVRLTASGMIHYCLAIVLCVCVFPAKSYALLVEPFMEAVLISDVSTSWTTVKLDNTYSNAIPVCIYYTNLPTVSGIQNITSNSFQLKIQGWENGVASTNDVHCLIVSNLRPYMASNVTVTDVLPAGLSYVPSSISGGDSTDDSDLYGAGLSWTIASLASSTSTTLTYTVSVLAP